MSELTLLYSIACGISTYVKRIKKLEVKTSSDKVDKLTIVWHIYYFMCSMLNLLFITLLVSEFERPVFLNQQG